MPKQPKFKVFQSGTDSQWYWHLVAPNGEIIAQSEGYKQKQSALDTIEKVQEYAPVAPVEVS